MDESKEKLSGIYLLPLIIKLLHASNVLVPFGTIIPNGHSLINRFLLGIAYTSAFLLFFFRLEIIAFYLKNNFIILILLIFTLSSSFWSLFPSSVIVVFVHFLGTVAVIICACYYFQSCFEEIVNIFNIWATFTIFFSFAIIIFFPEIGINQIGRWQGAFKHPNQFGVACIIAIWSNMVSLYSSKKKTVKLLKIIFIIITMYLLYKANSVTSIVCSLFNIFSAIYLLNMNRRNNSMNFLILFLTFTLLAVFLLSVYAFYPELFGYDSIFKLMGRDRTFTGRTDLWEHGIIAFKDRYMFGWGFDAGRSIFSKNIIRYGQFHNGYIDFAVSGGIVGIMIIVIVIAKIFFYLFEGCKYQYNKTIIFGIFFFTILLHNITEASLLRPLHTMWFMFLFTYFYLGTIIHSNKYAFLSK